MNAARLLREVRRRGGHLELVGNDVRVSKVRPSDVARLRQLKPEILRILQAERHAEGQTTDRDAAIRRWLPNLGATVRDRTTQREGRLWGVTRHGVIVDFGEGVPLMTLAPEEAEPQ